ncbi:sensor histidine kinase [Salinimicrobium sp. TH3]|uniref:sensor histidine kinase n=1 Tax=Salinimicrobium sp. TH3 TaxID=2997342 RepID=UPI00227445A6|nr:histidine kinase [Salinimicrobium sp. TH3]MCY2685724.1 histidine kinase [Salinimicrobium sp. TH3]
MRSEKKLTIRSKKWLSIAWLIYTLTYLLQVLLLGNYEDPAEEKFVWANIAMGFLVTISLIFFFIVPLHNNLKRVGTTKKITILFLGGFAFSLLYIALTTALVGLILQKPEIDWYFNQYENYVRYNFHNVLKSYIFLSVLLFAIDYFQRENFLAKREGEMKSHLINVQLENLKNQFQPHFLFNSLNSVVAVIDENKKKAQLMLIELSDLLRISIEKAYNSKHKLSYEIKFIEKYLFIEKIRFEDQLCFKFDLDQKALGMEVPCLILQPLVENAIKHGFKRNRRSLSIQIRACSVARAICIENNGAPLGTFYVGHGLSGVKDRLRIMYGDKVVFSIYQEGENVVNEIRFL